MSEAGEAKKVEVKVKKEDREKNGEKEAVVEEEEERVETPEQVRRLIWTKVDIFCFEQLAWGNRFFQFVNDLDCAESCPKRDNTVK